MEQTPASTDTPIQPNHDMRGWRMHIIFDAAKINALREMSLPLVPALHETIHYERLKSTTREVIISKLAKPVVKYLEDRVQLKSRMMSYANFIWSTHMFGGKPRANLDSVVAFTKDEPQFLYQEFPLDGFVGHCAGPDTPLTLKITKNAEFYVQAAGSQARDTELGDAFRQRFNGLPAEQRIVQPHVVDAREEADWLLKNLQFQVRKHPKSGAHVLQVMKKDGNTGDPLPPQDSTPWDELAAYILATEVHDVDLLSTFTDLAGLLLPWGYVLCNQFDWSGDNAFKASYTFNRESRPPADEPLILHPDPLVAVVGAGSTAHQIEVAPLGTAPLNWGFEGVGHGTLKPKGYLCDYSAPSKPQIHRADNSLCDEPTATKASFDTPIRIDRVLTGTGSLPLTSTFVILNDVPNLFIKTELAQGRLKLRFFYIQKGKEIEVPPDQTKWTVLAGGGYVNQAGIFTPNLLSRFAVVQAMMEGQTDWYWAYIIVPVPLMTAEAFVAQWNKA
ncbi:hypothetical protein [Pseudomonas putida]|uniref:hypothetical protein n=1 Tax=Pseudomonas putida TaxID=303 RepID=UPI0021F8B43D|nr:hypothetical protein [Pseudomonas putida]